jgi:sugar lactone lactonase YvrE
MIDIECIETQDGAPLLCAVGESPLWRADEAAWYWVDIPNATIHRWQPANGRHDRWITREQIACIAFDATGTLIAGMRTGLFALTLREDGATDATLLAAPSMPRDGMRFNDGRCDRQGRFWAGTMLMDMALGAACGALYRYTSEAGLSAPVVDDLIVQNGLAWSPDGTTMYLSDSHASRRLIWAYDYDTTRGMPHLETRRIFADLHTAGSAPGGRPDGAAVDRDGGYWTCANDGAAVLRYTASGTLDLTVPLPVRKPAMCAFGGADNGTLLVTSIRLPDTPDHAPDGMVLALRPGITGISETPFGGVLGKLA